ncbi:DeoR/GlpR family DNA-binding transcription regulator [Fibrella forsythiae]|uniref:DeoR/GlpR transcriptional regulator n=1 Tax=Fibrella forsythiae TaxID=2817061 RepID=A0ABS3JG21_9BACT|nr:DeoR/GlpR family DNA-binding transcription regulator [Fibrella forsythiae]MBO0948954.1 DeoR/GlpR transcriptional regulator [Fibrella forsythiae]
MNYQSRKRLILQLVEQQESVDVRELALHVQTSEMTIRRDLSQLAAEGLVYRTHGGAMRVDLAKQPFRFEHKAASRAEQKDQICQLAAQEIQEGETVFLDCGSTVFRMCPYIRHKRIQIITNSLPIVAELMNSSVTINLVGGEIDMQRQAVHGLIAEEHIRRYRAHRAFIGVDGISVANGLSAGSEKEASTALTMASQARYVYLLCDSSKFEQDKYLHFAPLTLAQTLITDKDAPPEVVNQYKNSGIHIIQ